MHITTTEPGASVQTIAAQIYEQRREKLLRIARRHGGVRVDPEEAVQEALALFLAHYDPESGAPPFPWLSLTLRRLCWAERDRRRHAGRIGDTPDALGAPDEPWWREHRLAVEPEDPAGRLDRAGETRERMARLKPDERRALSMIAFGYSYAEIGKRSGWTYTKVNRCVAEGRAALRVG